MEGDVPFSPLAAVLYARVREAMAGDDSGHDVAHVLRVRRLALRLAVAEGADPEVTELIALPHDVESRGGREEHGRRGAETAMAWLREASAAPPLVAAAIATLSWSGGATPPTLEGRVVQDADRLDAIGAVGMAGPSPSGGRTADPPGCRRRGGGGPRRRGPYGTFPTSSCTWRRGCTQRPPGGSPRAGTPSCRRSCSASRRSRLGRSDAPAVSIR